MKMNPIITQYKKVALSLVAGIAMSAGSALFAECKPCAAAAAIKQSIKDAQAAAIAAKPNAKPSKPKREIELDQIEGNNCSACNARNLQASLAKVAIAASAAATELAQLAELDAISEDQDRAPREELTDICPLPDEGDIDAKLQALFNCCVNTNQVIRCQGRLAEKCCNKLRHRIHTIKELIEDQTDDSAECCSLLESLMVSQIDQSAECCSVLESLAISQIDQTAECCSVIETVLGDPATTIASLQDCFIDVLTFVNTNNDDVLTWLKRLYVLMYQVFSCQCCLT